MTPVYCGDCRQDVVLIPCGDSIAGVYDCPDMVCPYCGADDLETGDTERWPPDPCPGYQEA